jgi:hypothetical protein
MARAKKRYTINFTNDRGTGSLGTYKSRAKAEAEMAAILRRDAYDVSIGYADLHLKCEIVESVVY